MCARRLFSFALLAICIVQCANAQSNLPNPFDVVPYSAIQQSGVLAGSVASVTSYNGPICDLAPPPGSTTPPCTNSELSNPSNWKPQSGILNLAGSLNGSIATALSVIPLASPASGVITKIDPTTGAELPSSSTLGPIFTERAETIGKHKFYIGLSNQDFHFKSFNGQSLKTITLLDPGGASTNIEAGGKPLTTFPTTLNDTANVSLSQDVAFLTYGITGRFDVSVGLPIVHAAVSSQTSNGLIYVGDGFNNNKNGNCWCLDTFTPGVAPVNGSGLTVAQVNYSSSSKTGFGDLLLRFKGNVLEARTVALALGADLRLPTGDERNFLGTGAIAVKPFAALSLYTKPWSNGVVFSPHLNVGWQIAGKSILGGQLTATPIMVDGFAALGPPFPSTKDYLPDVFSWAAGTEVALGRHNTVVVDVLGNQIGWIHGIQGLMNGSVANVPLPQSTVGAAPQLVTASGLLSAGRVSFGQYSGAFGYKARIVANLVATFNMLVRFDNNGLTARATPLYGLSYTF
ncbi:MAG: hypothetical protein WCA20_37015 [Candidatus Sulfotelmatobacter sp.]